MHIVARAESHSDYCLHHLSDQDLLASTRGQIGRSNQILAALLAHLAELEARGLYRSRACSSLYTYCIYELRMSEDAAWRRAHAARILRRFPVLYEQLAAGELHLTAVLLLGPHLTETNHVEVLARAKYRTKKEVQALVRQLDPLPDVPACIEPLGPVVRYSAASPISNPSAGKWTASLCGPVRELPPGERPSDWGEARRIDALGIAPGAEQGAGGASEPASSSELGKRDFGMNAAFGLESGAEQGQRGVLRQPNSSECGARDFADQSHESNPTREDTPAASLAPFGPQRDKVQFTASQEYVDLLEEARALLAHAVPNRALDEVHLRALRLLVAELRKRKYGLTGEPRPLASRKDKISKRRGRDPVRDRSDAERLPATVTISVRNEAGGLPTTLGVRVRSEAARASAPLATPVRNEAAREPTECLRKLTLSTSEPTFTAETGCRSAEARVAQELAENPAHTDSGSEPAESPRQRGRHIPAAVRRAVAERDRERCAYVDDEGRRCHETSGLEFHHLEPYACGGPPTEANLALRCRAHNGLAAELDFGRAFMEKKRGR